MANSSSEFDDDEASGDDSGDSLDTDVEIELTQQPYKSKQTLSAHLSAHSFLAESDTSHALNQNASEEQYLPLLLDRH